MARAAQHGPVTSGSWATGSRRSATSRPPTRARRVPSIGSAAGAALEHARDLVRRGLDEGAVGFSTGSAYYPGPWADTDELVSLCEVVSERGGVYVNEPRKREVDRAFGNDGLAEALEVARRTGV